METARIEKMFVVALAILLFLLPLTASAQDPYAGKLKSYESSAAYERVKVLRLGYSGMLKIEPGDAIFIGDTIKTAEGVKAQLELADGTVITLAPNSNLQIKGFMLNKAEGKRNSVLRALKGTFRFVVAKLFRPTPASEDVNWKESQVTIETQNAVAGVRGTDWFEKTDEKSTEFIMTEGVLNVRSSTMAQHGSVMLGSGQYSSVLPGGNPSPPGAPPPGAAASMQNMTTLTNPTTVPSSPGTATNKKPQYTDKDMARDLASGLPLSVVLDRAVEGGMTIQVAVGEALNVGASPSVVVYAAIIEGYPTNQVVESAIENGAPLAIVLATALAAGGDKMLVIGGAVDAGVPPPAVASTMAAVTTNGAMLVGTSPIVTTPSTIIPTTPLGIGGGGGATPSTLPASPYKP